MPTIYLWVVLLPVSAAVFSEEPLPGDASPASIAVKAEMTALSASAAQAETEAKPGADDPAAASASDEGQPVVARIGDEPIRLQDLLDWVRSNPTAFSMFGSQWGRNVVLHQLIKQALLSTAAQDAFADDPDAKGLPDRVLLARYQRQFLSPSSQVTDAELQAYYAEHKAQFGIPPMVRIRELFFPKPRVDAIDREDPSARAWSVYKQLQSGATMQDFAPEHAPDEASRQAGGDRGFLSILDRPQLDELTAELDIGAVSEPVELTSGYSIVQLLDRRPGIPAPFDVVRDAVERALIAQREGDLIAEFLTEQARERGVEILLPEYADAWPILPSEPADDEPTD